VGFSCKNQLEDMLLVGLTLLRCYHDGAGRLLDKPFYVRWRSRKSFEVHHRSKNTYDV